MSSHWSGYKADVVLSHPKSLSPQTMLDAKQISLLTCLSFDQCSGPWCSLNKLHNTDFSKSTHTCSDAKIYIKPQVDFSDFRQAAYRQGLIWMLIWSLQKRVIQYLSHNFRYNTHILESLEAAPPVTFATRSCDSSFFRSSSCLSSSSFFLPRRSLALILA